MKCVYDEEVSHCTGCLRTLDEVWGWIKMSNEEKQKVLNRIKKDNPEDPKDKQIEK
jgi:predicted Fe-S protein YdhL (DUF1289 family)